MPTETVEEAVRGVAQLNHYYTRSLEEFEAKRFRGSATGRIEPSGRALRPAHHRDEHDGAALLDAHAGDPGRGCGSLEPQPYTYGSELRLPWFPRPNDLGRFAEFAIANLAAGLA